METLLHEDMLFKEMIRWLRSQLKANSLFITANLFESCQVLDVECFVQLAGELELRVSLSDPRAKNKLVLQNVHDRALIFHGLINLNVEKNNNDIIFKTHRPGLKDRFFVY